MEFVCNVVTWWHYNLSDCYVKSRIWKASPQSCGNYQNFNDDHWTKMTLLN